MQRRRPRACPGEGAGPRPETLTTVLEGCSVLEQKTRWTSRKVVDDVAVTTGGRPRDSPNRAGLLLRLVGLGGGTGGCLAWGGTGGGTSSAAEGAAGGCRGASSTNRETVRGGLATGGAAEEEDEEEDEEDEEEDEDWVVLLESVG